MESFTVDLNALLTVAAAVINSDGVLLKANAGFLRMLPETLVQPVGAKISRFLIQPGFRELLAASDESGSDGYRGLMTIGDHSGKTRTLNGRAWRSAAGIQLLAEYDIAELERLTDAMLAMSRDSVATQNELVRENVVLKHRDVQLVESSLTDALTGVGNRRRLDQALAMEISRVRRNGGSFSAIMSDIDYFKRVNDEFGHGTGDKVLIRVATLLKSKIRPTDIVARFGGEEFFVLMPHTGIADAASKAEQLRIALAAEIIEPLLNPITSSFGVAELGKDEDGESFLRRIDLALYQAKAGGRNRVITAEILPACPKELPQLPSIL